MSNPFPDKPAPAPAKADVTPYQPPPRHAPSPWTRENLVGGLKTIAWVLPLTILIWVYAEREQVDTATIQAAVSLEPDAADRMASVREQSDTLVMIEIRGPRAGIDQLRGQLTPGQGRGGALSIPVRTQGRPLGHSTDVDVRDAIANAKVFRDNAVQVVRATPSFLTVVIDQKVTHRLPVVATKDDRDAMGQVTITAPEVEVTGPKLLFEKASTDSRYSVDGKLVAYADLSRYRGRKDKFEAEVSVSFPLADDRITLSANKVMATIEVKPPETASVKLDSVTVMILVPAPVLRDNTVEWDTSLQSVAFVGPPDQIAQVRALSFVPYAILKVEQGESQVTRELKTEDFHLPPGVVVEGKYSVTYRLSRR